MPKFTFEKIKALPKGRNKILQLEIDGEKQFDKFAKEIQNTQYKDEFDTLVGWMEYYIETGEIGNGRIKEVKGSKKDSRKSYEFRSSKLRLYAVQGDTGKIIVLCGYKKDQELDLKALMALKKQIFQSNC